MSRREAQLCLLLLVLSGCGRHPSPVVQAAPAPVQDAPIDPDRQLYEQMHTGIYQLGAAQDSLQTATETAQQFAKVAGGTATRGFTDLLKKLNSAGEKLGEYSDDLPPFEEFKKDISGEDDRRLDAIHSANDALGEIADAQDIVDNLLAGAPPDAKPKVQKIQDQLDETVDATESAVTEMGGKLDDDTVSAGSTAPNGAG